LTSLHRKFRESPQSSALTLQSVLLIPHFRCCRDCWSDWLVRAGIFGERIASSRSHTMSYEGEGHGNLMSCVGRLTAHGRFPSGVSRDEASELINAAGSEMPQRKPG
jgi:hypothetical protein